MTSTNAVANGYETTTTFDYLLKFVYNEGEGGEQVLVLSTLFTDRLPLTIAERWRVNARKYPYATSAHDGGVEKDLVSLDVSLACRTYDHRYIEKQARQIKEFFEAAPSQAVNVLWIDSAGDLSGYVGRVNQCKLEELRLPRVEDPWEDCPVVIQLGLSSLETAVTYLEPGDAAPSAANIYGSSRFRAETNDGSAVLTVVNDVTGKTLAVFDDAGNLYTRGSIITECDDGDFPV